MIINGVQFSEDLVWEDEFATARRLGSSRQTLGVGGRTCRQSMVSSIKKNITITAVLEGKNLYGYWTRAQVKMLEALEESGEVFDIEYGGSIYSAWVAPGGLEGVLPHRARPNAEDGDIYYGPVKFEEV